MDGPVSVRLALAPHDGCGIYRPAKGHVEIPPGSARSSNRER
jgi:hypothetical protein